MWDKLTGGIFGKVIDLISEAIPDPDKRAEITLKVETLRADLEAKLEGELSARHAADMTSDSWLSKNVRPLILITSVALVVLSFFLEAVGWGLPPKMVEMGYGLASMAVGFYFGSRGLESTARKWKAK